MDGKALREFVEQIVSDRKEVLEEYPSFRMLSSDEKRTPPEIEVLKQDDVHQYLLRKDAWDDIEEFLHGRDLE